eukprot:GHVT01028232.1.p2 GENE.GHVT01028232.1~~GHVT01028232.1.p2  ORF type:complete len:178 (-),score=43.67 GHVT01028232.1:684-1217(-)
MWRHLPQPSELLASCRSGHAGGGPDHPLKLVRTTEDGSLHVVDALMIFKEGIRPMWEDSANADGGHFEYRLRPNQVEAEQIDEYWNNLVLGVIGGAVQPYQAITGVRLVEKLNSGRGGGWFRIEVWFTCYNNEVDRRALGAAVEKCMAQKICGCPGVVPAGEIKTHGGGGNSTRGGR